MIRLQCFILCSLYILLLCGYDALGALSSKIQPLSLIDTSHGHLTLPVNTTSVNLPPPPSPYRLVITSPEFGDEFEMIFDNYGRTIPRPAVIECRNQAVIDAFVAHQGDDHPLSTDDHHYAADWHAGTVVLSLVPGHGMTWVVWRAGILGLEEMWSDFKTVEMIFSLRRSGEDAVLGLGYLSYLQG